MVPSENSPFEDGPVYEIRIVDPAEENEDFDSLDPCTGGDRGDPNDANCVTHYIRLFCGDSDGVLLTGEDAFVVRD